MKTTNGKSNHRHPNKYGAKVCMYILLCCPGLLLTGCGTSGQARVEEQQTGNARERIESGDFKINAGVAYPQGGRSVVLTPGYSIRVRNDSLFSHLPYFGRAYSIPYGGGDGLNFDAPMESYEVSYGKKGKITLLLTAVTREDSFRYSIEVYPEGKAVISVNMNNRQSIRFSGEME